MKKLLFVLMLAVMVGIGFAQVANYTFSYAAGTYNEITGGTVIATAEVGGSGVTSLDDVLYPNTPIPFLFGFNGRRYNQVTVTTNGYLIIGGTATMSYTPVSSTTVADGSIAILGRDLQGNVTDGNLGEIRYETLGSAPNRIYVVQWKNFRRYNLTGESYNFQIHLKEADNSIDMVFGNMLVNFTSTTHPQLGLRGLTSADYINRSVTTDWTASTAGTINTATVTLTTTVYPASGTTYSFAAPAATAIPNLATPVSPTDTATGVFATANLVWADGGGWTNGFKLYFGTDNPPTNLVNGTDLGYVTSYDPPVDMAFNTTHYWKIVPYNAFGDNDTGSVWSFTTADVPLTGTKTIGGGGDYATFTAAINALNAAGVGSGGVNFLVADGTYNENPPAINVSGTADNQIIFQAAPEANPVVTPAGGTGTFGFKLNGASYITFYNIDINGPNTLIYGYWLAGIAYSGASNNNIVNCSITVPYGSSTNYGIYSLGVTNGANSNNSFSSNTISSSYNGIYFTGSSTAGSEAYNNYIEINTITGVRNYAIFHGYGINSHVQNNQISFFTGGTTTYYGLYSVGSTTTATFQGNTINGGSTTSTVYAMYNSSGTALFYNNTVSNLFNTSSSGWYGFYASGGEADFFLNTITDISNTGTAAVYSAYLTTGNHKVRNCTIRNITTGGTSLYGIYIIGGTTHYVHSNKIHNLTYSGTGAGIVYGVHVASGTTNYVYNNMVYGLNNAGGTTAPQVRGFSITSGTTDNIWNNTVFLNSAGTNTNYSTAALYVTASTNTIDLKNNIFVNHSTPGATGRAVAFWKTTTGYTNFTTGSDRNIYHAGTPDATRLIGYNNTTAYQTLAEYKLAVPFDQASYSESVPFVSNTEPYDLHINPAIATRVEGNAQVITEVTLDIDGNTRNGVTPDIGADEGDFTAIVGPPIPPEHVTLVSPVNNLTGVDPLNVTLLWIASDTGGIPQYYEVYVSNDLDQLYDQYFFESPATTFDLTAQPTVDLGFENTWYWAILPVNDFGSPDIEAPEFMIWRFTTKAQMQASSTLDLGNVWPGGEKVGTITVQNIGDTELTFDAAGSPEFAFGTLGRYAIPANSSVNLPYTFTAPTVTGLYSGFVTLTETTPGSSVINITVSADISGSVSFGDGSVNIYQPVYPYYGYTFSQTIYPAAWFDYPDGYRIEKLRFYWNPALAPLNTEAFKVWLGHTTQESFPSTGATWLPVSQMTLVFDGTWNITAEPGWKELVLQVPFTYNQTDNLVLAMDENTPGYDTSGQTTNSFFRGTATTGIYRGISYYSDSVNPNPDNPVETPTSRAGYPNTMFVLGEIPTVPVITVTPESWDFGSRIIHTYTTKEFSISNSGVGTLSVSEIAITGDSYFTLVNVPTLPLELTAGQSATFGVRYAPTVAGGHTATVSITNNDSPVFIGVSGTCTDPTITVYPHLENFDGVTTPNLPDGWSKILSYTTGTPNVTTTTTTPVSSPYLVYMTNSTDAAATVMLVSPPHGLDIGLLKTRFYARSGTTGQTLLIGTVDNIAPDAVFTQIGSVALTTTNTQYTVELNSYAGDDVFIAFKHGLGATSRTIYMDNIEFIEMVNNDLSALSITGPDFAFTGEPIDFTVTVKNEGLLAQDSYTVHLVQADVPIVTLNVNSQILPGAEAQHTLQWTPLVANTYDLYGRVVLTGDQAPGNDETLAKRIYILPDTLTVFPFGDPASTVSVNYLPLSFYYKNSVTETIYFEDEMRLDSGTISTVVYKNNFTQELLQKPVQIYMAHTSAENLTGGWLPDTYTLVFNGLVDFPLGANYIIIPLTTPFNYTGGNLAVRAYRPMDVSAFNSTNNFYYTNSSAVHPSRSRYLRSDTVTYDPLAPSAAGTISSYVPLTWLVVDDAILQQEAVMNGYVYEAGTEPPVAIEGALVTLTDERYTTTTDENGFYEFRFWEAHTVSVNVSKFGYYDQIDSGILLESGVTYEQDYYMVPKPRVTVSGIVTANDAPAGLEGALVKLLGIENLQTTTGAGGAFSFADVIGHEDTGENYTLTVSKENYESYSAPVAVWAEAVNVGTININEIAWPAYDLVAAFQGSNVQLTWDPAGPPPFYFNDFETDNGGWVPSSNWSNPLGDWEWANDYNVANFVYSYTGSNVVAPPTAFSGTGMWGTKMLTNHTNANGFSYLTQTLDFTGFTNTQMRFRSWENLFGNFDYAQVRVNGTLVWGPSWDYSGTQWQERIINLSAYDGLANVTIVFEMYATSSVNYAGWYFDDLYIGPAARMDAPTQLASASRDRVLLSYNVYRLLAADEANPENWNLLAQNITETSYLDTGLTEGGTYKWAVIAKYTADLQSEAILSNALTYVASIDAPLNVVIARTGDDITLSWDAVTGATTYKVYASDDPYSGWTFLGSAATNTYLITAPAAAYKFYYVTAANE
jgi:hypothetical protein